MEKKKKKKDVPPFQFGNEISRIFPQNVKSKGNVFFLFLKKPGAAGSPGPGVGGAGKSKNKKAPRPTADFFRNYRGKKSGLPNSPGKNNRAGPPPKARPYTKHKPKGRLGGGKKKLAGLIVKRGGGAGAENSSMWRFRDPAYFLRRVFKLLHTLAPSKRRRFALAPPKPGWLAR